MFNLDKKKYEIVNESTEKIKIDQSYLKSKYGSDNPCVKEQQLSFSCLENSDYNKEKCVHYFDNYKKCKSFWLSVERSRKTQGITPALPDLVEREKIKTDYLKQKNY